MKNELIVYQDKLGHLWNAQNIEKEIINEINKVLISSINVKIHHNLIGDIECSFSSDKHLVKKVLDVIEEARKLLKLEFKEQKTLLKSEKIYNKNGAIVAQTKTL